MTKPRNPPMTAHPKEVISAYEELVQKEIQRRGTSTNVDK